jgi:riboflavin kinase / FMN adenylyltransferase
MPSNDEKRKSLIPPTLFVGTPRTEPMARVYSAEEWVERFHKSSGKRKTTVVTIGNFDGVHLGHRAILRAAWESAGQLEGMSVALTFFPHPAKLLRPGDAPQLLMTLDQRLAAIEQLEIDATLVLRFDEQLARLSPQDFVNRYLKQTLKTWTVVYGENFRFGHKGAGDASTLHDMGIDLQPCPPVTVDGVVVSSTAIRTAIRDGRVDDARRMLGRPYALEGEIRIGTGRGRKLVVPTLNLDTDQEVLPKNGVYATEAVVVGKIYRAATNVGMRPTFDGARITIESHLFDFSENLNGGRLEVRFWQRLRDERKFSGPAELREQVLKDIEQAKDYFGSSQLRV